MLNKAETRAPLSGVISRRYVEVGQWIDKGAPVADLLQLDPLYVEVNVPEDVIARIRKGDLARVEFDALDRKTFSGTVEQIVPQADAASRTFRVRVLLPNPDLAIWPGFFARASLTSRQDGETFLVPKDAIVTRETNYHVVAVRDGKAVVVPVTLGRSELNQVSVSGPLVESDLVVTRGNETLQGGEMLIVMNPPTTQGGAEAAAPGR
jgi:RND family efflux transporter MFP subunit